MKKRTLALTMAAVMAATCFAGCGSSEEAKTEGGEENGEIVLKVFDAHAYGLDEYDVMKAAFEADHPGVKVEVQHAANDANALLQSRVNSGDIPDVFDVESGMAAQSYYEYAYDWTEDTEVLEKFGEAALKTGTTEDGKVMSLPWTYENMGLIYNVDCFEKAGITELPATMDELEEACKKLKEAGITPIALAAKETWVLQQVSTHFMMDKELNAKGVVEKINNGELTFKDMPNFDNLYRFLDMAVEYGPAKPMETDWETCENMLANGEAAIIHMGDWCQATLNEMNPDLNAAFLPFPVSDKPEDATLLSSCNWTYIVNKDSKNLELAKEYAEYILSSEEGQKWMCQGVGSVPGVNTDMEIAGKLANDAKNYVEEGKTNAWIHTISPVGYGDNVGPMMQSYMMGEMSKEDVTQGFQDFWVTE